MAKAYIPANGGPRSWAQPLGTEILGRLPTGWYRPGPLSDEDGIFLPGSEPMIAVIAIKFASGHKNVMTDKGFYNPGKTPASIEKDFEPGGGPFPDWQWQKYSAAREYSYPVSHTRNERITLTVMIDNEGPAVKGRVVGNVLGLDVGASMRFEKSTTFIEGVTEHQIDSDTKIRDAIFSARFRVEWEIIGPEIAPAPVLFPRKRTLAWNRIVASDNEILVTAGSPIPTGSELTYARLAHSVKMISATGAKDTRKIVEKLVKDLVRRFTGLGGAPTWALAFSETSKADCRSQADYIVSMLKMIGAPGTVKAVIVYVRPKGVVRWKMIDPAGEKVFRDFRSPTSALVLRVLDDHDSMEFTIIEEDAPMPGVSAGLAKPQIQNHTGGWRLRLIDRSGQPNVYEGCVKIVGAEKYNAAGTTYGELEKEEVIPTVFESVAWYDYGANEKKKVLKSYP
jgi:hypothetical protein